jgi:hypothetical protein
MINLNTTLDLPIAGKDGDFDRFIVFLRFINNVEACKARLTEINEANQAAHETINSADKVKAEIQRDRDALAKEKVAHAKQLTSDRAEFQKSCDQRDQQINERVKQTDRLNVVAKAAHDKAEQVTAELTARLERIKAAVA